ncbi:DNA ligase D [Pseudoxanthomonas kaohsiungensis]|uniref:DNA ligase (ATP) n=1 Tax=Pseudoxanthomonas kaohsiungensis TaxID=283923 RepID=A0ABW3LWC5_9GAMM|nr:DNA ligase D [Pseudoxanthomonas kaohsiungensis]KAF1704560.1 DNA ligase D [Pseudoxanthomonas kaohsiungensis]
MSLHDYARKRDFGATPEPQSATRRRGSKRQPIFVVQLHHASRRHYDFRLEADGVLKSWAVPKGPSLRAGDKRLAVEVEDHPLDYAGFEGDIPEGHYGAGHVDIFDQGTWTTDGEPLAAIARGSLDFELHGDKLKGAWKLVRTGKPARQPQWLLIKRSDDHAADVEADDLVGTPSRTGRPRGEARAPIAAKSAKAAKAAMGTAATGGHAKARAAARESAPSRKSPRREAAWRERALALEGARDRPHPSGFAAELCTLREAPPSGDAWLHEIKWDGYRLLADLVDGQAKLRSRNDLDWTARVPAIARAVEALPVSDAHLDGELVVLDDQGHSDFSALQRVLEGSSRQPLRYVVFDLPGVAGVDLSRTALVERKRLLRELLGSTPGVLAYSDHVVGHGAEVFAASGRAGFEGIISKRVDARYRGGRGQDWIKVKHEDGDEFVVVGYTAPKGARGHFGSLLLARPGQDGLRYVGRVGSGFGDAMLRDLFKRMRPLETAGPTVELPAHVPLRPRNVQWLQPRLVVEVAFRGWAKEGLLRQASFRGLREDKDMADLMPEKPAASRTTKAPARTKAGKGVATAKAGKRAAVAKTAAVKAKAKAAPKAGTADGTDVVITHPERVVYPADGMTKGDVAAYYRAIAPWLLRDIAGRPLSLVRCPDGATGQCFFQKHHGAGFGEAVHALPLRQKSGIEDYVWIDDATGLMQLVQMNVLEFHPWGATVEDPERADRLVFDLDPGEGVPWKAVCDGAREVRGRLREAGLESFLRMSGGKGLHVVVPLAPAVPWEQARDFCEAFARAMEAHAPDRWLANARKAKRTGRIFLDWLRNTRGATSVASWSLRAREHATVAMPLRWEELGKFDRPGAFNPDKALQRASRLRKDPWDGIDRLRQSLPG